MNKTLDVSLLDAQSKGLISMFNTSLWERSFADFQSDFATFSSAGCSVQKATKIEVWTGSHPISCELISLSGNFAEQKQLWYCDHICSQASNEADTTRNGDCGSPLVARFDSMNIPLGIHCFHWTQDDLQKNGAKKHFFLSVSMSKILTFIIGKAFPDASDPEKEKADLKFFHC
jgi:hypothetical protein